MFSAFSALNFMVPKAHEGVEYGIRGSILILRAIPPAPTMRSFRLALLPFVLLLILPACQGWRGEPLPGAGPSPREVPSPARVALADGRSVVVWHGGVERDSLIGLVGERSGERARFAVPVAQVRRMDGRRMNVASTGLTIVSVLAAVGVAMVMYLGQTGDW